MEIITIPCGPVMANSYIVRREGSPTCAVIDPADAGWQANLADRRAQLSQGNGKEATAGNMNELDRTRHVLEAHNTLRSMNHKNNETFGYVCETLEEDLMRHEAELGERD